MEPKATNISNIIPYSWIKREITFCKPLMKGNNGREVKNIQEWLCLHGYRLVIDGDFGPATEYAVKKFQRSLKLKETGIVGEIDFDNLVGPMLRVLTLPSQYDSFNDLILKFAQKHLLESPREVGGENRGPWVRLYMRGNQGPDFPWCAGFISFILMQAAESMNCDIPIKPTFSCDKLAFEAKAKGLFVSERELAGNNNTKRNMPPGSIFLRRKASNDWSHTGFVLSFATKTFQTIEGNTNDDGSREGYEVCRRTQGYSCKDFIRIA